MSGILLPSVYFGNHLWYRNYLTHEERFLEKYEYFEKQTYRNRCTIYGANGKLDLIIPIKHGHSEKQIMKDVRISNDSIWQRTHWRSFESAYRAAPYFEFYENKLVSLYEKRFEFLIDFNLAIHEVVCEIMEIPKEMKSTTSYVQHPENIRDFRDEADPKVKTDEEGSFLFYTQVFGSKHGFIPNLSVADLLFNVGPEFSESL